MLKKLIKMGVVMSLLVTSVSAFAQNNDYPRYSFGSNWALGGAIDYDWEAQQHGASHPDGMWRRSTNVGFDIFGMKKFHHAFDLRIRAHVPTLWRGLQDQPVDGQSYYMARYIFGLKTDETPLVDIVNDGEENETYTVADDILGVYIAEKDPTRVYAKDYNKHRKPSTIKDGETDFVKDDVHLQSDQGWDQSNWVLLDFGTSEKAQKYLGKVIKGGTLTGVLTNKLNPTMTVTESTVPTETGSYDENHYIGCNFMDPNVQSNIFWHGSTYNFFFVEPKPQEYVKVHWARYNGGSADGGHFDIVTDSELKGSFNVDWSLYPGYWEQDFIVPNAYSFHAIVRYVEGTKASAVEGNYMVFPLEGGDIVTAIENVSTRGEVASVTYVNMLGVESSEPFAGINIVVTRYTTGETVVTKELRRSR